MKAGTKVALMAALSVSSLAEKMAALMVFHLADCSAACLVGPKASLKVAKLVDKTVEHLAAKSGECWADQSVDD